MLLLNEIRNGIEKTEKTPQSNVVEQSNEANVKLSNKLCQWTCMIDPKPADCGVCVTSKRGENQSTTVCVVM